MDTLVMIFIVISVLLFILAAFRVATPRMDLGWLGMAFLATGAFILPLLK